MSLSIRITDPSEAEELSKIQKAAFKPLYEKYHDEGNPFLRGPEDILRRLNKFNRHFTILYNDKVVGGVFYRLYGKRSPIDEIGAGEYYLARIYIHPDYQNKGIARDAILLCEKEFPDARFYYVDFPEDMEKNRRCYQSAGYCDTGERICMEGAPALAMFKKTVSDVFEPAGVSLPMIYEVDKNELNVVVYFEEQGIYSNQPGAEFYITIYGSIAQSESENISANVKWGKARSAKEGNVPFHYKNFLGYRKGADGKPEIDPEEAETIRFIYERFLAGDSLSGIAQMLNDLQVPTPSGKGLWQNSTIQSILSNEKYKGDAIINKTYIKDCLSKKVMVNNGERPKYYVENNHPAIIDAVTFGRVQEELARRSGKPKTKQVGTKTEQGKYSSKYAMTELLVCGECKTPYRRCTWTVKGQKKIVWRCINRLDFGKKYCHNSPTVEESILQRAVMRAIMETAQQNLGVLQTLKVHIGMGLQSEQTEDNSMELQIRIAEIDAEFKAMLAKISTDTVDAFDEEKAKRLMDEKAHLQQQLGNIRDGQLKREQTQSRLDDIYTILDGLKNRPMEYDEQIVRQLLECITVDSKEQITVIFVGGLKVVQPLID